MTDIQVYELYVYYYDCYHDFGKAYRETVSDVMTAYDNCSCKEAERWVDEIIFQHTLI